MDLLVKTAPLLARIWRKTPPRLRAAVTWTINGKVIVGVSGVLLTDSDQALLLRHRFHHPAFWGMPGGWLAPGETIADCWRREIREELALDVAVEGIIGHRATRRTLEFFLLGRISGGQLAIDPLEIVEARLFSAEDLPPMERFHLALIRQTIGRRRTEMGKNGNDAWPRTPASDESCLAGANPAPPVREEPEDAGGVEGEALHV